MGSELAPLEKAIAEVQARIDHYRLQQRLVGERIERCDILIRDFNRRTDPTQIPAVQAWAGRYGKRGALNKQLRVILQEHPEGLSTFVIGNLLAATLGTTFLSKTERIAWVKCSVGRRLQEWCNAGAVQVEHPPGHNARAIWRLAPTCPSSLDEVRARAEAAGLPVRETDADDGGFE